MFINTKAARNNAVLPRSVRRHRRMVMPTLHLEMHPGRTLEQKRDFVSEVTRVTAETLACPPESVDILISEVPRDAWAKGGKLVADR
ncbi:MAG: 4-oxalocrotonate tautomerase [Rhodanobacter sp.]